MKNAAYYAFCCVSVALDDVAEGFYMDGIPLDTWMTLAVSYNHTSGVGMITRDCQQIVSSDVGPNLMIEIDQIEIGRINQLHGANTHCKNYVFKIVSFS